MPARARTGSTSSRAPRARNKIRGWFTKERRDEAIEQGKEAIARAMRKQNLPLQKLMSQDSFAEVAAQLRYDDVSALYAAVGEGHVSTQSVHREGRRARQRDVDDGDRARSTMPGAVARASRGTATRACSCAARPTSSSSSPSAARRCPATRSSASSRAAAGVSVHRADCHNVQVAACASPSA